MGYRDYPHTLKRYLAFVPTKIVWSAQVNGAPSIDPVTGGIYAITYDNNSFGTQSDTAYNDTIWIGTAPGLHDVGIMRVRTVPSATGVGILETNETPNGEVLVQDNHYISILQDHRPWQIRMRRVDTSSGDSLSFDEFQDYHVGYGGNSGDFRPPAAIITRDEDPEIHQVLYAGFEDTPGCGYRTVDLSAFLSYALAVTGGTSISDVHWEVMDCSYVIGSNSVATIQIQVPVGYREIWCSVNTAYGSQRRYIPLLCFSKTDPSTMPITQFAPTKDSRGEGREMSFIVSETPANMAALAEDYIPKGTRFVYWEEEVFFGDDPAPAKYISQYTGWSMRETTLFRKFHSMFTVEVGGLQSWASKFYGYAQTFENPRTFNDVSANVDVYWHHILNNRVDLTIHTILMIYTNFLELGNFFISDVMDPIEGHTTPTGSIWSQITDAVNFYVGTALYDSDNALWLRRHYDYLEQEDRDDRPAVWDFEAQDWQDSSGLEVAEELVEKVGSVEGYGSNYDVLDSSGTLLDFSQVYHAFAPAIAQGYGTSWENAPYQYLPEEHSQALARFKRIVGHHFARLNNTKPDVSLVLKGNLDIFEPARGEPVTITYDYPTLNGRVMSAAVFLVKEVNVAHSNDVKKMPKTITLSLEQATMGTDAQILDTIQKPFVITTPPIPDDYSPIPPYTGDTEPTRLIEFDSGSPRCHVATSWIPSSTTIITTEVSSGFGSGACIWATANPYNYLQYYALMFDGLYFNPDPFGGGSWTLRASNTAMFGSSGRIGRFIAMSINLPGYIAIMSGSMYVYSFDYGATWNTTDIYGSGGYQTSLSASANGFAISPFNSVGEGWIYAEIDSVGIYKSEDWGATWTFLAAQSYSGGILSFIGKVAVPYKRIDGATDNINDASQEVYSWRTDVGNETAIILSQDAGATWSLKLHINAGGGHWDVTHNVKTGWNIMPFTYDGSILQIAGTNHGAQDRLEPAAASGGGATIINAIDLGFMGFGECSCQGYPIHSEAGLFFARSSPNLWWSLDSVATLTSAAAPAGYTGIGYAEWNIGDIVPPP